MKKTELTATLSRTVNKVGLQIKKRSPEILIVAGVVGTVTRAVMACKATLKVDEIMRESNDTIEKVHKARSMDGQPSPSNPEKVIEYTADDAKSDLTKVYIQTGLKLAHLYAPSVILGALSITCFITSHNIMRKRCANLAAAYGTLDTAFKKYRERVAERFGEEVEKEIRYNIKAKEIEKTIVDPETGEEKTVKETVKVMDGDPSSVSPYAVEFSESNPNYCKDPNMSFAFLRAQQQYFNDLLQAKGHVFLNEVYDALGLPRTKAGAVVGWVFDSDAPVGDNYIDFGMYTADKEKVRDFVNGVEPTILLDFNVDGVILDLIASHQAIA